MLQPQHPIVYFDGFTLDLRRGCLFRHDAEEVRLRAKSFEVLRYLVENSGRLISKEELIGSVWRDTAVTDDSLVQCLIEIRRALDDTRRRFIKTVPRRGYVFLPAVTVTPLARQGAPEVLDGAETPPAVTATRVAVLPFRLLKADADVEFLSYSLADAITSSLTGLQSLVVRSSLTTMRYGRKQKLDIRSAASELDVDLLLTGTLLRTSDDLRVSVELIEANTGKAAWSQISRVSLGDIFEFQDSLAQRIVSTLPLTPRDRERIAARDAPHDKRAYELFLRANRHAMESNTWRLAHRLYEECVERDPSFAPAWARLGRIRHVLRKYNPDGEGLADDGPESALRRALELNPELSTAHLYLSQLETDLGRAEESMARLLRRARSGWAEPEILAGLVHACRFCGLLDASVAAHDMAMRLDPSTETSVLYSYFALGRYEQALEAGTRSGDTLDSVILSILGRQAEARAAALREEERFASHPLMCTFYGAARALVENRFDDARAVLARRAAFHVMDGEATYHTMRLRAFLGDRHEALRLLECSVRQGFFCVPLFDLDPWLASIRRETLFIEVMRQARAQHERALVRFDRESGPTVLGTPSE